jgi:hypothetical protein
MAVMRVVVEIEEGAWQEVTKSFTPLFHFSSMHAIADAISLLILTRAGKDAILH